LPGEAVDIGMLVEQRPIEPGDGVVLAVGVVDALSRLAVVFTKEVRAAGRRYPTVY